MAVYVDAIRDYGWWLGPSCHLFADTVEELDQAAQAVGMKPSWRQVSRRGIVHYDLIEAKRRKAIKNGAIETTRREAIRIWDRLQREQANGG